MHSKPYLYITAKILSKVGTLLGQFATCLQLRCFFNLAIVIDPKCLEAYLQIAYIFVNQNRFKEAGAFYKKAIAIQPTLSTVYNLGLDLAQYGNLNDKFYQAILHVVETPEIILMIKTLAKSPTIYQPSKLWLYFMIFNTFQLETGGIVNFKRTVNNNYFNWTANLDVNTQFQALTKELKWSNADLENAQASVHFDSKDRDNDKFTRNKMASLC